MPDSLDRSALEKTIAASLAFTHDDMIQSLAAPRPDIGPPAPSAEALALPRRWRTGSQYLPAHPSIRSFGLSLPEIPGRWSEGPAFGFSMPWPSAEAEAGGLVEIAFGVPFLPLGPIEVVIHFNGRRADRLVFDGRTATQVVRYSLGKMQAGRMLAMTAMVVEPARPCDHGPSGDERQLGVVLHSVALVRPAELRLLTGVNGLAQMSGEGWHPGDTVLWARSDEARLVLPASRLPTALFDLSIGLVTLVDQPRAELVIRALPGTEPAADPAQVVPLAGRIGRPLILRGPWPRQGAAPDAPLCDLELCLRGHVFCSPDAVLGNGDTRRIGIGVADVTPIARICNARPAPDSQTSP